ncbi:hypothetical protein [Paracoccus zeaxanthinifaciens]|uniref:hypothetical protein n=1 Tax=Paracoccus zeaxanthinifaciens TaxID=187400 RepID=UPI0003B5B6A5|nr:hypothetical protein [Paracoccus zeaxanthinifaciens]
MRTKIYAALAVSAVTLAGCVAPVQTTAPAVPSAPAAAPAAPTQLDEASRQLARNAVNTEMQSRLAGSDTTPYTNCVMQNATTAELIDIAQMSAAGSSTADSVAAIVSRPATTQCIASVARSA